MKKYIVFNYTDNIYASNQTLILLPKPISSSKILGKDLKRKDITEIIGGIK